MISRLLGAALLALPILPAAAQELPQLRVAFPRTPTRWTQLSAAPTSAASPC